MKKRSVLVEGHATSVSVEDEFWAELKRMAAEARVPVATLIGRIDAAKQSNNLSSTIRLAVLADLKASRDTGASGA